MHRHSQLLTGYVPHGLLQAAYRAIKVHGAAPAGDVVVGHLGEVLDVERVPAHQVALQLIDMSHYLKVPVRLGVTLPPTVDAFVGIKFDEAQVLPNSRMGEEGGHSGDFQLMSP